MNDRDRVHAEVANRLVRSILEALCQRDRLSLGSAAAPGEPARNYELAARLGIGYVFDDVPDDLA